MSLHPSALRDDPHTGANHRPGLLVSVRSALEAEAALAGEADLIDVKEPTRGSLGRADEQTIAAVLMRVSRRRPVSAALGELKDGFQPFAGTGLSYAKWGLAGCADPFDWRQGLEAASRILGQKDPGCRAVAVAYGDWRRAQAPSPGQVCTFAVEHHWAVLLLDTWRKDGTTTLLNWLSLDEIEAICRRCHAAGVRVALAGSLQSAQLRLLRRLEPDWFAVRGAACRGGERDALVETAAVRRLIALLAEPISPTRRDS